MHTSQWIRRAARGIAAMAVAWSPAVSGGAAFAGDKPPATGRIHYQMTSPMVNATVVMAWVDHGKKTRQDMKMSVGGGGQQAAIDSWTVTDGSYIYTYQPAMGRQVMRMRMSKAAQNAAAMGVAPRAGAYGKGTVIGKGTVLGHPCEIRSFGTGHARGQGKVWLWNGMLLKMQSSAPGGDGMTMVATRVETAPTLSPSSFQVPAGYQVKDFQMPAGAAHGAMGHPR
jgi:hypothetical protein